LKSMKSKKLLTLTNKCLDFKLQNNKKIREIITSWLFLLLLLNDICET